MQLRFWAIPLSVGAVWLQQALAGPKYTAEDLQVRASASQIKLPFDVENFRATPTVAELLIALQSPPYPVREMVSADNIVTVKALLRRIALRADPEIATAIDRYDSLVVTRRALLSLAEIGPEEETGDFLRGLFDEVPWDDSNAVIVRLLSSKTAVPNAPGTSKVDIELAKKETIRSFIQGATEGYAKLSKTLGNDEKALGPLLKAFDRYDRNLGPVIGDAVAQLETPSVAKEMRERLLRIEGTFPLVWNSDWDRKPFQESAYVAPFWQAALCMGVLTHVERPEAFFEYNEACVRWRTFYSGKSDEQKFLTQLRVEAFEITAPNLAEHLVKVGYGSELRTRGIKTEDGQSKGKADGPIRPSPTAETRQRRSTTIAAYSVAIIAACILVGIWMRRRNA